jgi:hypothetical protein
MILTIGQIIFVGFIGLIGLVFIGIGIHIVYEEGEWSWLIIAIVITVLVCGGLLSYLIWYNTHTASGARTIKDYESELNLGIERNLKIVADDGMIIYEREGHFDIEIHDNYIVFDENHQRTILYRSLTTTMIIEELE